MEAVEKAMSKIFEMTTHIVASFGALVAICVHWNHTDANDTNTQETADNAPITNRNYVAINWHKCLNNNLYFGNQINNLALFFTYPFKKGSWKRFHRKLKRQLQVQKSQMVKDGKLSEMAMQERWKLECDLQVATMIYQGYVDTIATTVTKADMYKTRVEQFIKLSNKYSYSITKDDFTLVYSVYGNAVANAIRKRLLFDRIEYKLLNVKKQIKYMMNLLKFISEHISKHAGSLNDGNGDAGALRLIYDQYEVKVIVLSKYLPQLKFSHVNDMIQHTFCMLQGCITILFSSKHSSIQPISYNICWKLVNILVHIILESKQRKVIIRESIRLFKKQMNHICIHSHPNQDANSLYFAQNLVSTVESAVAGLESSSSEKESQSETYGNKWRKMVDIVCSDGITFNKYDIFGSTDVNANANETDSKEDTADASNVSFVNDTIVSCVIFCDMKSPKLRGLALLASIYHGVYAVCREWKDLPSNDSFLSFFCTSNKGSFCLSGDNSLFVSRTGDLLKIGKRNQILNHKNIKCDTAIDLTDNDMNLPYYYVTADKETGFVYLYRSENESSNFISCEVYIADIETFTLVGRIKNSHLAQQMKAYGIDTNSMALAGCKSGPMASVNGLVFFLLQENDGELSIVAFSHTCDNNKHVFCFYDYIRIKASTMETALLFGVNFEEIDRMHARGYQTDDEKTHSEDDRGDHDVVNQLMLAVRGVYGLVTDLVTVKDSSYQELVEKMVQEYNTHVVVQTSKVVTYCEDFIEQHSIDCQFKFIPIWLNKDNSNNSTSNGNNRVAIDCTQLSKKYKCNIDWCVNAFDYNSSYHRILDRLFGNILLVETVKAGIACGSHLIRLNYFNDIIIVCGDGTTIDKNSKLLSKPGRRSMSREDKFTID